MTRCVDENQTSTIWFPILDIQIPKPFEHQTFSNFIQTIFYVKWSIVESGLFGKQAGLTKVVWLSNGPVFRCPVPAKKNLLEFQAILFFSSLLYFAI
jgi:hypothetical protein